MFADHNKASITNEMIKKDVQDLVKFEKELYLVMSILRFHLFIVNIFLIYNVC